MWDQTAANFSKSCLIVVPNLPDVQFAEAQREKWCTKKHGCSSQKASLSFISLHRFFPAAFQLTERLKEAR